MTVLLSTFPQEISKNFTSRVFVESNGDLSIETQIDQVASVSLLEQSSLDTGKIFSCAENEFVQKIVDLRTLQKQYVEELEKVRGLDDKQFLEHQKRMEALSCANWVIDILNYDELSESLKNKLFCLAQKVDAIFFSKGTSFKKIYSEKSFFSKKELALLFASFPVSVFSENWQLEMVTKLCACQLQEAISFINIEEKTLIGIGQDFVFYPETRKKKILQGILKHKKLLKVPFTLGNFLEKVALNNPSLFQKSLLCFPDDVSQVCVVGSFLKNFYPQTMEPIFKRIAFDDSIDYSYLEALRFQLYQNERPSQEIRQQVEALSSKEKKRLFNSPYSLNPFIVSPHQNFVDDDKFSINLLWINDKPLDDPKNEKLIDQDSYIDYCCDWIGLNPKVRINCWYDAELTHPGIVEKAQDLMCLTLQKREYDLEECDFLFRDIREIYRQQSPSWEELLDPQNRMFLRVDFTKSMIAHHVLMQDDKSISCFFDLDCMPMSKGEIFNIDVATKLFHFGCVFANPRFSIENSVILMSKVSKLGMTVVQAHKEIFLDTVYEGLKSKTFKISSSLIEFLRLYSILGSRLISESFGQKRVSFSFNDPVDISDHKKLVQGCIAQDEDRITGKICTEVRDYRIDWDINVEKKKEFIDAQLSYDSDDKESRVTYSSNLVLHKFPIPLTESWGIEGNHLQDIS